MIRNYQYSSKKISLPKNNHQIAFLFVTRNNLILPLFWEKYFQQQSDLVDIHIYTQHQYNQSRFGTNVTIYTEPKKNYHQDFLQLCLMLLKKSLQKENHRCL